MAQSPGEVPGNGDLSSSQGPPLWIPVLFFTLVLFLNILFTLSQMACASIGENVLEELEEENRFWYRRLLPLLDKLPQLEHLFGRCALAMMVTMALASAWVGIRLLPTQAALGATLGMVWAFFVQMLACEAWARHAALKKPDRYLFWIVPPTFVLSLPLSVFLLPGFLLRVFPGKERNPASLGDMHLRLIPSLRGIERVVDEEAFEMIDSVRDFAETTAEEIMTPRTEVQGLSCDLSSEEIYDKLRASEYSRLVVYHDRIDNVVGTLLVKEVLLNRPNNPMELMHQPVMVSEKARLPELLKQIRSYHTHLIVVLDEYGGMAGIVTLHDLFEMIVGSLEDIENEDEFWIEKVHDQVYRLDGRVEIWEINDKLGLDMDEELARTIGGFVFNTLGRVAEVGDEVINENVHLSVEGIDGPRVAVVGLTILASETGKEEEG